MMAATREDLSQIDNVQTEVQNKKTKKWRSMRRSEWAGGWTRKFAERLLLGAAT